MFGFRGWGLEPSVPKCWGNSGAVAGAPPPAPPRAAAGTHGCVSPGRAVPPLGLWTCICEAQGPAQSWGPQNLPACPLLLLLPTPGSQPQPLRAGQQGGGQGSAGLGLRCFGVYLPVDPFVSKLEIALGGSSSPIQKRVTKPGTRDRTASLWKENEGLDPTPGSLPCQGSGTRRDDWGLSDTRWRWREGGRDREDDTPPSVLLVLWRYNRWLLRHKVCGPSALRRLPWALQMLGPA